MGVLGSNATKTPCESKIIAVTIASAENTIVASKNNGAGRKKADSLKAVPGTERIGYAILTRNVTFNIYDMGDVEKHSHFSIIALPSHSPRYLLLQKTGQFARFFVLLSDDRVS